MTIRFTETTMSDKLLSVIGKKRAVRVPKDVYKRFGPYVIVQPQQESFWRALVRTRNQEPPDGWFYCENTHFD